jgi:BirA family biotin operon repressor/biotin-[acetyl-CoA-carboxylase] ligase
MTPGEGAEELADRTHWAGEPLHVWEALWGVPKFEAWTAVPSTNDRARSLARAGAPAWTVVVADTQTAGRGRSGAAWLSSPGAGLWVSVLLRPRSAATSGSIPLLTGVALARALETEADASGAELTVGLKWPNDLHVEGRKVAGILCETVENAVVIGVGLNLRRPAGGYPGDLADRAGALETLTGTAWSDARVLGRFLSEARRLWEPVPARFEGRVAEAWSTRDILRGRRLKVDGVDGVALGIQSDGALRVEVDGVPRPVRSGHVEWWDPS